MFRYIDKKLVQMMQRLSMARAIGMVSALSIFMVVCIIVLLKRM